MKGSEYIFLLDHGLNYDPFFFTLFLDVSCFLNCILNFDNGKFRLGRQLIPTLSALLADDHGQERVLKLTEEPISWHQ